MHDITIRRVNRGWVVQVGCQTLVFTDPQQMSQAFSDYMTEGHSYAEKKWCDVNRKEPADRAAIRCDEDRSARPQDNAALGQMPANR